MSTWGKATTSRLLSTHPGSYEHGTFGDQLGDDLPVQVPENGADLITHTKVFNFE